MALNEKIISATTSHQINVVRFGASQANGVIPFLNEAEKRVSALLLQHGQTIKNKARLRKLLADTKAALNDSYRGWTAELSESLKKFAGYEGQFSAGVIDGAVVNIDVVTPTDEQIIAASRAKPMLLNNQAIDMPKAIAGWSASETARANRVITHGFYLGQTTQQIAKNVRNTIHGVTKNNAMTIARTSVNHVATVARQSEGGRVLPFPRRRLSARSPR